MDIKRITGLYSKVQSIPYYCMEHREPDLLLKRNRGSCSEKHLFLGEEFEKLGIPVRYISIIFDWNDLPIPKEIISKKDTPVGGHLILGIKVAGRWVLVDATWDPALEGAGFPITKNWDGRSDTKLAAPPREIMMLDKKPHEPDYRPDNRKFYEALNRWLESQRKISGS
jgi:hypothetical protein